MLSWFRKAKTKYRIIQTPENVFNLQRKNTNDKYWELCVPSKLILNSFDGDGIDGNFKEILNAYAFLKKIGDYYSFKILHETEFLER